MGILWDTLTVVTADRRRHGEAKGGCVLHGALEAWKVLSLLQGE